MAWTQTGGLWHRVGSSGDAGDKLDENFALLGATVESLKPVYTVPHPSTGSASIGGLGEASHVLSPTDDTTIHRYGRFVGDEVVQRYSAADSAAAVAGSFPYTATPTGLPADVLFPTAVRHEDTIYLFVTSDETDAIYLASSTDGTAFTVLNSGSPIITASGDPNDVRHRLYNTGACIEEDGTIHCLIEASSLTAGAGGTGQYSTTSVLLYATASVSSPAITLSASAIALVDAGCCWMAHVPERNALFTLYCDFAQGNTTPVDKFRLRFAWCYLSDDPASRLSWKISHPFEGGDGADPDIFFFDTPTDGYSALLYRNISQITGQLDLIPETSVASLLDLFDKVTATGTARFEEPPAEARLYLAPAEPYAIQMGRQPNTKTLAEILMAGNFADERDILDVGDLTAQTVTAGSLAGDISAGNIVSDTLDDARLSSNVPLKNTANTFIDEVKVEYSSSVAKFTAKNTNSGGQSGFDARNNVGRSMSLNTTGTAYGVYGVLTSDMGLVYCDGNIVIMADAGSGIVHMAGASGVEYARFTPTGLRIAGNVGIGEYNPASPLHIRDGTTSRLTFGDYDALSGHTSGYIGISQFAGGGYMEIQGISVSGVSYGDLVLNLNGGNVAVGAAVPASKLDIRGTIRAGTFANPSAGSGTSIELGFDGTQGIIQTYDRTNTLGKPLFINVGVGTVTVGHASCTVDTSGNLAAVSLNLGGSTVNNIMSATSTINFNSIAANGVDLATISVTGALVGDAVFITPPPGFDHEILIKAEVSSSGTVTMRLFNGGPSPIDPASGVFRATVIQFA